MIDIIQKIKQEEGFESEMYDCPAGYKTIGYGVNLETTPIPEPVARAWVKHILNDINVSMAKYEWFRFLDRNRRVVILDMCYQMGVSGVLKFKKMIAAIEQGNFDEAANQMLDSKWAKTDSPNRAMRNSNIMRGGR